MSTIRQNVVGGRCQYSTPFGKREMVYADYTASGRCLKFLEEYMMDVVGPMYANTHTEASMTGAQTTKLREEARAIISQSVKANEKDYAVLFTGTGSTGAIDKLFRVLGFDLSAYSDKWGLRKNIPEHQRPVVFVSHLEHHSNELIWRHSIARCIVIDEDESTGFPNLSQLERELRRFQRQKVPMVGSFSAGSNVTGMQTPVRSLTKLLHRYGAYAFFDYAGVGAYVDIDVQGNSPDEAMDAIFLSPHKFIGGPGAAGVLVARRSLFDGPFGVQSDRPTLPGGGTVSFVSERYETYADDIESKEDAGTPGILQCIRAGLAFKVKEMVGSHSIHELEKIHGSNAIRNWNQSPSISLVGSDRSGYFEYDKRVSIVSFNILSPVAASIKTQSNKFVNHVIQKCNTLTNHQAETKLPLHYNFVISLLNDVYGIQARGGCSCAGPYGQRLFGMGGDQFMDVVNHMADLCSEGDCHSFKIGWARLNFNYFISKDEASFMVDAVNQIATHGWKLLPYYIQDVKSGQFHHRTNKVSTPYSLSTAFGDLSLNGTTIKQNVPVCKTGERSKSSYDQVLKAALKIYAKAAKDFSKAPKSQITNFTTAMPQAAGPENVWWLQPSEAAAALARTSKPKTSLFSKNKTKSPAPVSKRHPAVVKRHPFASDDASQTTRSSSDGSTSTFSANSSDNFVSQHQTITVRKVLVDYDGEEMEC